METEQEWKDFLQSYDFMKVGQAINREQWEIAMMTVSRLERNSRKPGLEAMNRNLKELRNAILAKNTNTAKNLLALVIQKRVQMLKHLQNLKK